MSLGVNVLKAKVRYKNPLVLCEEIHSPNFHMNIL